MTKADQPIVHALADHDVVFVTGATGFLGREIVRQLAARSLRAHALVRSGGDAAELARLGVVLHPGDLTDRASVLAALAAAGTAARAAGGRLHVIHSGALISYQTRDRARAWDINVGGTKHVLEASRAAGVARFVFVSSVVAVGSSADGRAIAETAPFDLGGLGVHYTDTKRAAEELVLAASDLDVVVVNPGAIFGPTERESNTVRFLGRVAAGRGPIVAPPGSISLVGLADTARGTLLALERGRRGERYILVESFLSSRDLFALLADELGGRRARATVPRWLLRALLPLVGVWDRFFPMDLTPPQALAMLAVDLRLDGAKARRELGWEPRPFRDVLRATIAELRRMGRLPPERSEG